jgi:hypothetical protein
MVGRVTAWDSTGENGVLRLDYEHRWLPMARGGELTDKGVDGVGAVTGGADGGGADDHPVGKAGDFGGVLGRRHADADADRLVGECSQAADERRGGCR